MGSYKISNVGSRDSLPIRREPYWNEVGEFTYLGFRKGKTGRGAWIARYQAGKKKSYRALGKVATMTHGEAVRAAIKFGDECRQGTGKSHTVIDLCENYLAELETQGRKQTAHDARLRFRRTVYSHSIATVRGDRLTTDQVRKWLKSLLDTGNKRITANRTLAALKAALSLAYDDGLVSATPWRKVKSLPTDASARTMYLDLEQRQRLLDACRRDLREFIQGMLYTGCRTGELRNTLVQDFDKKTGTLTVRGKTGQRSFELSTAARVFFARQAEGKTPRAALFTDRYGESWAGDTQKKALNRLFEKARRQARLSDEVVPYTCRHTRASDMLAAGIDIATVAKVLGTSVVMIERHYHKFIPSGILEKLDAIKEI